MSTWEKYSILYDLNDKNKPQKTRILRSLYGFKDKSCHGKYEYQRRGTLSKIPYKRSTKTALLLKTRDYPRVMRALKEFGIIPIVIPINS